MTVKIPACTARSVRDDPRHVLGTAEHIDDVDPLAATQHLRQLIQRGHRGLAQDGLRGRRHGNDPVAEALQGTRDTVARAGAIGRETHDRDGVRGAQQLCDLICRGVHEHGNCSLASASCSV